MAGKGSRQRPTDTAKYESNWERIFRNEPGMGTSSLEYTGAPNAHTDGESATAHTDGEAVTLGAGEAGSKVKQVPESTNE